MSPDVSVIVPNFNGAAVLGDCLASLARQSCAAFEVIIVDNGSHDGSADSAERIVPGTRVIRNPRNEGYCAAANQGIRASSAEFVVILNNDTVADPCWLERLVSAVRRDERIGACSSKQFSAACNGVIDSTGMAVFKGGYARNRGRGERDSGQYDRETEVFGVAGAAALYRRRMLDRIGLFDEDFFAYQEEFDLCWRARLAGWKCVYAADAVVAHVGGMTAARNDEGFLVYQMERNRILVLIKDYPVPLFFSCLPWIAKYELDAALRVLKGETAPLRARLASLRLLPSMLRKRRRIQSGRAASVKELRKWLA